MRIAVGDGLQRLEDFQFFIAHRIGGDRGRRLHGDKAEQLQHVVLHHVAQCAGGVVIAGAAFDAQGLGNGDLHMIDMGGIPHRLEQGIGKAQGHEVLHRLFAEIMIDAIDVLFEENPADRIIDGARRAQILAQRLFDHDARLRT